MTQEHTTTTVNGRQPHDLPLELLDLLDTAARFTGAVEIARTPLPAHVAADFETGSRLAYEDSGERTKLLGVLLQLQSLLTAPEVLTATAERLYATLQAGAEAVGLMDDAYVRLKLAGYRSEHTSGRES